MTEIQIDSILLVAFEHFKADCGLGMRGKKRIYKSVFDSMSRCIVMSLADEDCVCICDSFENFVPSDGRACIAIKRSKRFWIWCLRNLDGGIDSLRIRTGGQRKSTQQYGDTEQN